MKGERKELNREAKRKDRVLKEKGRGEGSRKGRRNRRAAGSRGSRGG